MTHALPLLATESSPGPSPTPRPRTRRALLAGVLGGLAAWATSAAARVNPVQAAAGSALIIGSEANNAGSANTQLLTSSSVVAFKLLQNGPGTALMGYATPVTGTTRGVYGRTDSPNGDGVQARNAGAAGSGAAMQAIGGNNTGLNASTENIARSAVQGTHTGGGYGVSGVSSGGFGAGVYGFSSSGYAGYFPGALYALSANAAIKAFRIDHPLDPAGRVLMHACVESDERLTLYAGTVTTDERGEASVELPAWFSALNRDLRYQLTVIGSFAQAMVKQKISGGRFLIATSDPHTEVCWQLSGVRQDAYAIAHRLVVEGAKTGREQGRYLNPAEHGQPERLGVDYELRLAATGSVQLAPP